MAPIGRLPPLSASKIVVVDRSLDVVKPVGSHGPTSGAVLIQSPCRMVSLELLISSQEAENFKGILVCLALHLHWLYTVKTVDSSTNSQAATVGSQDLH